ncbi:MAG TPA: Gfo/Idh/MocA family oxidoreductase [Flavitalea sp.]|nr:Gfo/Idh/MocA family oxidoreductase [Flavitalea sp.]
MSEPIKTALLSFGMSGSVFHAPFITHDDRFQLYAVWEREKNLANQKYPFIQTFRSLEDLLKDPQIELVVVNTPNSTHAEYSHKCLEAGKHVIVEKPFTITSAESRELIQLAAQKHRVLSVYHNRRFDSDFKTVVKVIEGGRLGKITEAEFHFDRYKEGLSAKTHKEIPAPGTGALYDLGAHLIDQALSLFGMPQAVFADIRIIRPLSQVDDYFELLFYYPDKRVRLHCSYLVKESLQAFILHGAKGSFVKYRADPQETQLQENKVPGSANWGREPEKYRGILHIEQNGTSVREEVETSAGNYGEYYQKIFEAVRNNAPAPVSGQEAEQVIRIIETAFQSSKERRVVDL